MSLFSHAKLALTVAELHHLPADSLGEVAFAGRSNAGKSSAINALTHRRRLAFVARKPGKTRLIQLFELAPRHFLVDLPGYGYAQVDASTRRQWGRLVDAYLGQREPLKGLILIMDVRHPLTPLDRHLVEWFLPRGRPVHVLLTKADKLSRSQALGALRGLERLLAAEGMPCTVQLFSSQARSGVEQAQSIIAQWLDLSARAVKAPAAKIKTPG
ncbi:MAG: YihA family ribosome biogenesis GTP-binding protein [Burkholderiales bacterium]|nr:YihA family ribosome biogenesis GTP-binding protein [Burkholderiales bacterium]